jgi:hypothetical protein
MAKLKGSIQFTGSIGDITAYLRNGEIIIRKKQGVDRRRVKYGPEYERTREGNKEFGGRSTTARMIMRSLHVIKPMADYKIHSALNGLLTPIQKMDTESARGKRNVFLTKNPRLLEGFTLNQGTHFDSIVRTPVVCSLSRETLSATINIPELVPGINFVARQKHSMFQIVVQLGLVPDMMHTPNGYKPVDETATGSVYAMTEWQPIRGGADATTLSLALAGLPPQSAAFSLMLSIGISFGEAYTNTMVKQTKHAGAAKVLGVV